MKIIATDLGKILPIQKEGEILGLIEIDEMLPNTEVYYGAFQVDGTNFSTTGFIMNDFVRFESWMNDFDFCVSYSNQ